MEIDGKTQLLGLLGHPVSHSFSPAMHNAAAADLGLNYAYLPLAVDPADLAICLQALPKLGFRGVNVTIPHKQAVMAHCTYVDGAAQAIGAVNTIVFDTNGSTGYNTDHSGFLTDLAAHDPNLKGRPAVVLGAGGSARAIVYALLQNEHAVHLYARRQTQAEELLGNLSQFIDTTHAAAYHLNQLSQGKWDAPLIVNTTPLGMAPNIHKTVWPEDVAIPANSFVYDLVYNPRQTRLVQQAQAANCQAMSGIGMLLWQGAKAFELWSGLQPDIKVMANALTIQLN